MSTIGRLYEEQRMDVPCSGELKVSEHSSIGQVLEEQLLCVALLSLYPQ